MNLDPTLIQFTSEYLSTALKVCGGIGLVLLHKWLHKSHATEEVEVQAKSTPDFLHKIRYQRSECVTHRGSCHCGRIQFNVRASRRLHAVDVPSRIRYPRVTIHISDFESLSSEDVWSLYPVYDGDNNVGVHCFCSFCGVQIMYSPSVDPQEILINVECLNPTNIENIDVAYYGLPESLPCAEHSMSRQGAGYINDYCSDVTIETLESEQGSIARLYSLASPGMTFEVSERSDSGELHSKLRSRLGRYL